MRRAFGLGATIFVALALWSGNALARTTFQPRVGAALGLVPSFANPNIASGTSTAVDYNGGVVMAPSVTVHTIFWAPSGLRLHRRLRAAREAVPDRRGRRERHDHQRLLGPAPVWAADRARHRRAG